MPKTYLESYIIIQTFADLGNNESASLFLYHNEVVKDYLKKCFDLMNSQPKDKLIDLFLKQTKNINFFYIG